MSVEQLAVASLVLALRGDAPVLAVDDWGAMLVRVTLAIVAGGAIGGDREVAGKPAGLRTHMLVSLGSALFVMAILQMGDSTEALSRAIQGVAAGVGFLGAGEILQKRKESGKWAVKGLTSAAAIWLSAALGVLAGCGLWQLCAIGGGAALLILVSAKWFERHLPN